jgi:hypothetical protein
MERRNFFRAIIATALVPLVPGRSEAAPWRRRRRRNGVDRRNNNGGDRRANRRRAENAPTGS